MPKVTRETRIRNRVAELNEIYSALSEEKRSLARKLIENLAFIEEELDELQVLIADEGSIDEYKNGANQYGKKLSANLQAYNALVKSYNLLNNRLESMLPEKPKKVSKLEALANE